jgi:hypothetical protein
MANVLFRRGDQTYIDDNVPLFDGQVIFNETDKAIYVDSADSGTLTRTRYGGGNLSRSDVDATLSTSSINPIQNKAVANAIGNLSSLDTTNKSSLVGAVNEVNTKASKIGNLADLDTTDKSSAVAAINEVNTKVSKTEVLIINVSSFSSLPQTVSNSNIEDDMVVVNSVLGTPLAQTADWTITTSNGSLTISGTSAISGSTTATLYLMKSR